MKKNLFALLFLALLFSCSTDDGPATSNQVIKITSTPPEFVRIGETVSFSGENLDLITNFKVGNHFGSITEQNSTRIKVTIPTVYEPTFSLTANKEFIPVENIPFKLVGTYPLATQFTNYQISEMQLINENIAFCIINNAINKSINGGKNWALRYPSESTLTSMFFLDEHLGWIGTQDGKLLKTTNGGSTFTKIFEDPEGTGAIMDIRLTSSGKGYILHSEGDIFKTENGSTFQKILDLPYEGMGSFFSKLYIKDDLIVAFSENRLAIKKPGSAEFEIKKFEYSIWDLQVVKADLIFLTTYLDESLKLFKSNDHGATWQVTGEQSIAYFHFIDQNTGIGSGYHKDLKKPGIFETHDGGKTWIEPVFILRDNEGVRDIAFYGKKGIITGWDGKIWHHIIP